jgi:WD40 repeat protein
MFHVGSYDGTVGVWDANAMECVHLYPVSDCVNVIASGVFAATSPLIAVGTKSDQLRLLDARQEANTHTLVGHTEQVTECEVFPPHLNVFHFQVNALAWSNWSPHTLVSGDIEGTMFVWDLRKPVPVAEVGSRVKPSVIGPMGRRCYLCSILSILILILFVACSRFSHSFSLMLAHLLSFISHSPT